MLKYVVTCYEATLQWCPPPAGFKTDVPLVHALYETYRLWHRLVLKFPKSERYSLGQEAGQTMLHLLQHVLLAASVTDAGRKRTALQTASVQLDTLRLLIRLAKDCDCIKNQEYLALQSQLHHSGKMLGGWLKSLT